MKEKKSNLKSNEISIDDAQKTSLIRLIGLFMIVYCILCFTSSEPIGCALSVPFTFLFGSCSWIILLMVMLFGFHMLIFKKVFKSFSTIQWVLISLAILFSLVVATAVDELETMTFSSCFAKYVGKEGIYRWNYKFLLAGERNVSQLGGGMVGYMLFGLINSITAKNYVVTCVISWIIFIGVLFILFAPVFSRIYRFIKKIVKKIIAKRKEKKQRKAEQAGQNNNNKNKKGKDEVQPAVTFNVKNNKSLPEDLLETTEINVSENVFNINNNDDSDATITINTNPSNKDNLVRIISVYDEDIYPNNFLHISKNETVPEPVTTKLNDTFSEDFSSKPAFDNQPSITVGVVTKDPSLKILDELTKTKPVNNEGLEIINDINKIEESKEVKEVAIETNNYEEVLAFDKKEIKETVEIKPEPKVEPVTTNVSNVKKVEDKKEKEVIKEPVEAKEVVQEEVIDYNKINYELPPLYLLQEAADNGTNQQNYEVAKQKAEILKDKMRELNVSATINDFVVGPSVTRFEIALSPGVRVGSFTNLQEDFKLALGVNSIRIESPIPGKSAIGIEVPNVYRGKVSMKEIITAMPPKKHKLYVPIGKDITGNPLSTAICDMPHCLISGATNSGKSVCANTIILSLLMNYKPSEVRMIMVDPKRVEMLFYKDIPHLLCPIITDSEKARVALDKLCIEMDNRFSTFAKESVKNIATYNEIMEANGKYKMPFIILIVDEFAELMLCKNHNVVEEKIQKLAQLGRAAGIHLILATQRPDVNVIPGTIKTNLPCRMTFRLSSVVDSRTVIDVGGAEKLLNNGDMLLLTPDFTGLRRVQGVYVSDKEISEVVEHCKKQAGTQYDPNFLDLRTEEEKNEEEKLKFALYGNNNNEGDNVDTMYEEIKNFVIKEGKASTSFLQRKFGMGYSKAARYIDMLEENGIIGPENGSKPREVLVSSEEINERNRFENN